MKTENIISGKIENEITLSSTRTNKGFVCTVGIEEKAERAMYRLMARYMASTDDLEINFRSSNGACKLFAWGRANAADLMINM